MNEAHEAHDEVAEAHADRDWWYKAGQLIDPEVVLYDFSYRHSASFRNPDFELTGKVAKVLIRQARDLQNFQSHTMIPMIDAGDLPLDVEGYCAEHGHPLHYDTGMVRVDLENGNPLAEWLQEQGYEFSLREKKRGWGNIVMIGT